MISRASLVGVLYSLAFFFIILPTTSVRAEEGIDEWHFTEIGDTCTDMKTKNNWTLKHTEKIGDQNCLIQSDPGDPTIHDALFINPKGLVSDLAPRIEGPIISLSAADYSVIRVRMKSSANKSSSAPFFENKARIFFRTNKDSQTGAFDRDKVVPFRIFNDGAWREIHIYVGNHKDWKGTITQIRVDPTPDGGATNDATDLVAFDYVKLIKKADDPTRNAAEFGPVRINGQVTNEVTLEPGNPFSLEFSITNKGTRDWADVNGFVLAWQTGFEPFPNSDSFHEWHLNPPATRTADDLIATNVTWFPALNNIIAPIPSTAVATDYTITFGMVQKPQGEAFDPSTSAFNPEASVTIIVHVVPGDDGIPCLQVSESQLDFQAHSGDTANPPSQTFNVSNCGGGTLHWSASVNQNWVRINPASGTNSRSPSVVVDLSKSGTSESKIAIISVNGIGALNSPKTIRVNLSVKKVPVIYISGLPGSELIDKSNIISPIKAFLPCGDLDELIHTLLTRTALNSDGLSPTSVSAGNVIRGDANGPFTCVIQKNVFGSTHTAYTLKVEGGKLLMRDLINNGYEGGPSFGYDLPNPFGATEASNRIPNTANLYLFPYDWRRDLREAVVELDRAVDWIFERTGANKVDIIAHSTGGLVARYFVNAGGGINKVRNIFLLGVPTQGLALAYFATLPGVSVNDVAQEVLGLGWWESFLLQLQISINSETRDLMKLARNWPAVYQLMPSRKYFSEYKYLFDDQCSGGGCKSSGKTGPIDGTGDPAKALEETYKLNGDSKVANLAAFKFAEDFRAEMGDDFNADFRGNIYVIVGYGRPTITRVKKVYRFEDCLYAGNIGVPDNTCRSKAFVEFEDGDGAVPYLSATEFEKGVFASKRILRSTVEHGRLPDDDDRIRKFIVDTILKGKQNDIIIAPGLTRLAQGLFITRVASPVTLHIYDSSGNHTGPDANDTFIEKSPGADYWVIGDTKTAILSSNDSYKFVLVGQDNGITRLSLGRRLDEELKAEQIEFRLETDPRTVFVTNYDPHSPNRPRIAIDKDGDQVFDEIVGPTLFFDGMEDGVEGWRMRGLWHLGEIETCTSGSEVSVFSSPSPFHAWYYGREESCSYSGSSMLVSPSISLPTPTAGVFVSFKYHLKLKTPDLALVSVSFDGGRKFRVIWSSAEALFEQWAASGSIFVPKPAGARTMKIRFLLKGKNLATPGGWLVDNLHVQEAPIPTASQYPFDNLGESSHPQIKSVSIDETKVNYQRVTNFRVQESGIKNIQVKVFDLAGQLIFDSGVVTGNTVSWKRPRELGKYIPNGVYLYVVTALRFDKIPVGIKIGKMIIINH